ncbi:MORN repeat domain-containing protein [Ditylenchus destructor]|uniref:MORN repeat domain-containing protein n=1 Tax=Ditylenchus destructor TaxID=166010 RepID=A0AAD4R2E0_9BILA|nr:MORN repeat domain-containing protein [Ditylenchus destructor]
MNGGRFDFDDGGTFCGGWEEGKAHGHGICTGPESQGEYAGAWHYGFEVSGIYTWPSGSTYMGQWQNGKRHGLGVEQRGRWIYKGEWTQGFKGRYGRREAINSGAHYLGTWSAGLHDGYGSEIYADGGSYKGQWLRGMRHGYGIRVSAPYGVASKHRSRSNRHASLTSLRSNNYDEYDENNMNLMDTTSPRSNKEKGMGAEERENAEMRGGFVLKARSSAPTKRRRSLSERSLAVKRTILSNLRIKKQHSTGDIHQRVTSTAGSLRSSGSTISFTSDESDHHRHAHEYDIAPEDKIDPSTVETYKGEWKNDGRAGYGVCERSDGLRYAGEWQDNKKHGYGVTFFKDGTKEEGRYKNNVLVCSTKRRGILFVRTSKLRERVETHLENAKRAAEIG